MLLLFAVQWRTVKNRVSLLLSSGGSSRLELLCCCYRGDWQGLIDRHISAIAHLELMAP